MELSDVGDQIYAAKRILKQRLRKVSYIGNLNCIPLFRNCLTLCKQYALSCNINARFKSCTILLHYTAAWVSVFCGIRNAMGKMRKSSAERVISVYCLTDNCICNPKSDLS